MQGRNQASKVGDPKRTNPGSRTKPEKERGRGLRRGLGESLPIFWNFELQIVQCGVLMKGLS